MAGFYSKGLEVALKAVTGVAAAPTGTLKGAFMATSYTQNQETQSFWSDISASIASGTTVRTISGAAVNIDTTNNRVEIDFNDPSETPVTATTNQFVLYMDTGVAATSPLIACGALSTTLSPVGGTLTLTVNAEGLAAVNY
jgi:preprotein translocase subunit YajC